MLSLFLFTVFRGFPTLFSEARNVAQTKSRHSSEGTSHCFLSACLRCVVLFSNLQLGQAEVIVVKCSETTELFFLAAKIWWICMRQNILSSRRVSKGVLMEVFTWKPQLPEENKIREEKFCPLARICCNLQHQILLQKELILFLTGTLEAGENHALEAHSPVWTRFLTWLQEQWVLLLEYIQQIYIQLEYF